MKKLFVIIALTSTTFTFARDIYCDTAVSLNMQLQNKIENLYQDNEVSSEIRVNAQKALSSLQENAFNKEGQSLEDLNCSSLEEKLNLLNSIF